jgi:hypothetical protein
MARQITLSTELSWQPEPARYFKTEPTDIVPFSFGICENKVFSNVIDSYHLVDERYIKLTNDSVIVHFQIMRPVLGYCLSKYY